MFDVASTALVVVDVQRSSPNRPTYPHAVEDVIERSVTMVHAARAAGMKVVLVRVYMGRDDELAFRPPADAFVVIPRSPGYHEPHPDLPPAEDDIQVIKHTWNAFYGTSLDLQLRAFGITTLIVCGLVTNIGVEATVRGAFERQYAQFVVEDACGARSAEQHEYAVKYIFRRIATVLSTEQVLGALTADGTMS